LLTPYIFVRAVLYVMPYKTQKAQDRKRDFFPFENANE